jgi:mRNA interferase MazF
MVKDYIPERGDLIWLHFTPQSGSEQSGRRPALVMSHKSYNAKVGMLIACPVTTKIKGYPFELPLSQDSSIDGVILSDQIKSLDWKSRKAEFICKTSDNLIANVLAKISMLIT